MKRRLAIALFALAAFALQWGALYVLDARGEALTGAVARDSPHSLPQRWYLLVTVVSQDVPPVVLSYQLSPLPPDTITWDDCKMASGRVMRELYHTAPLPAGQERRWQCVAI